MLQNIIQYPSRNLLFFLCEHYSYFFENIGIIRLHANFVMFIRPENMLSNKTTNVINTLGYEQNES